MKCILCAVMVGIASQSVAAQPASKPYPLVIRKGFVAGCIDGDVSSTAYCQCTIEELEKRMDYKEFEAVMDLSEDEIMNNEKFADAVVACVDKMPE